MLSSTAQVAAIALALVPSLATAAIFPKDTQVKMLDPKGFKQVMKRNQTSMVAFVAPWCGHCQRMAPEYSKAALGLYPLVPAYAVDCDANDNKRLCAEQGVQGFPTVKLFPRGSKLGSMTFESGDRTSSAFFYWASRRIPHPPTKFYKVEDIHPWVEKNVEKHRVLLLTKDKQVPLLWKVLSNKYKHLLELSVHRDRKGKSSVTLGLEAGEKASAKVLIYPAGSLKFIRYEGITKHDSLSKFFDSILDGTADLSAIFEQAKAEEFVPDEKELEIEEQQRKQKLALAHGGFTELIDFEKAVKDGAGADYHATHGYPGMMGTPPPPKKDVKAEDADAEDAKPIIVETEQVVFEQKKDQKAAEPPVDNQRDETSTKGDVPVDEKPEEHPKDEL